MTRSLKILSLSMVLALGAGGAGYALASGRPAEEPEARIECAVPRAVHDSSALTSVALTSGVRAPSEIEAPARPDPVAPEPRPSEPTDLGDGLHARRLVLTHAIEGREPVDELDAVALEAGERLYAFMDLANTGEATTVEVTFEHESGLVVGRIELEVPAHAGRHRTWAYSSHVAEPGNWTAMVRDGRGHTVTARSFEVR